MRTPRGHRWTVLGTFLVWCISAACLWKLLPVPPRAVAPIPGPIDMGYGLAADNRTYLWANQDTDAPVQTVHLWDAVAGKERLSFEAPQRVPIVLQDRYQGLSPRHCYLVIWDMNRKLVRFWDAETGAERAALPGSAWCMSGDDRWLARESADGQAVLVWDMANGRQTLRIDCPLDFPEAPGHGRGKCFSLDGQTLAVGVGGEVQLWNMSSQQMTGTLPCGEGRIPLLAFTPDGGTLVSCSFRAGQKSTKGKLTLWDTTSWQPHAAVALSSVRDPLEFRMRFTADGKKLFFSHWHNTYRVADLMRLKELDLDDRKNGLNSPDADWGVNDYIQTPVAAGSPDGKYSARYERESGVIVLVTGENEKVLRTIDRENETLAYLAFAPDSRNLIVGTGANAPSTPSWFDDLLQRLGILEPAPLDIKQQMEFWNTDTGRLDATLQGAAVGTFQPDGNHLVAERAVPAQVVIWEMPPRKPWARILLWSAVPAALAGAVLALVTRWRRRRRIPGTACIPSESAMGASSE